MLFLCSYWSTAPTRRRVPQTERPDELSTVVHIDSLLEIKPADSRERSALIPIFCWFNDLSAANKHFQLTDGDQQTSTAVCSGSLCLTWWVGFYIKPVKPLNERVYFLFSVLNCERRWVWQSTASWSHQLSHQHVKKPAIFSLVSVFVLLWWTENVQCSVLQFPTTEQSSEGVIRWWCSQLITWPDHMTCVSWEPFVRCWVSFLGPYIPAPSPTHQPKASEFNDPGTRLNNELCYTTPLKDSTHRPSAGQWEENFSEPDSEVCSCFNISLWKFVCDGKK